MINSLSDIDVLDLKSKLGNGDNENDENNYIQMCEISITPNIQHFYKNFHQYINTYYNESNVCYYYAK